jgi:hypothetical protein
MLSFIKKYFTNEGRSLNRLSKIDSLSPANSISFNFKKDVPYSFFDQYDKSYSWEERRK